MTQTRPASMNECMRVAGVPRDAIFAASVGAMAFIDSHFAGITESAAEWRKQRGDAFPHVHGEADLASWCLACGDPFPCEGYYRDIDQGVIGGEQ